MTDEQINIAIAESRGWKNIHIGGVKPLGIPPHINSLAAMHQELLPNYTADLNACHEFEKTFNNCEVKWGEYRHNLMFTLERERHELHATAHQRCEAYLKTIGKWKNTDHA